MVAAKLLREYPDDRRRACNSRRRELDGSPGSGTKWLDGRQREIKQLRSDLERTLAPRTRQSQRSTQSDN
jgi:hypothetical protein